MLCDGTMPNKRNGKIYRTVVIPPLLYVAETLSTTKSQGRRLHVNEMRMLRWMCGITKKYNVINEHVRESVKVVPVTKKIAENVLKVART